MPKYVNNLSQPIYVGGNSFPPNTEVETYDTIDNRAFAVGTVAQNYNIVAATNDTLYIKFNEETAWTTVTLTDGAARTAAQIVADINTAYGSVVASVEGGKVRLDAPIVSNTLSAVYNGALSVQSTAASATLGLSTNPSNPIACVALQAFAVSTNISTYNITTSNNTFIFKVNNNPNWITVSLTTGAARTAAEIVAEINTAYETATADANKVAFAIEPITGSGEINIKLLAPVFSNFKSKLYIKSTGNTALSVLGFSGDNFNPIAESLYPSLIKTSELPLFNPMISETGLVFSGAETQHYYLTDPDNCRDLQIVRVGGGAGISFTIYLESTSNLPPFTVASLETITINIMATRITKIVIVSNAAGSLTVREFKA